MVPVICAIPPNQTVSKHASAVQFNMFLSLEAKRRNIPWIDWNEGLTDPSTSGDWREGLALDGVHPNEHGAKVMGVTLWRQISKLMEAQAQWQPSLAVTNYDPHNLCSNGLFLVDANGDGTADGFGVNAGGEFAQRSIVTDDPDIVGNWQRFENVGGAFSGYGPRILGVSPGDRISVAFRLKAELESGGGITNQFGVFRWPQTVAHAGSEMGVDGHGRGILLNWKTDIDDAVFYHEYTVRSIVDQGIAFQYGMTGSGLGSFQIAQLTIRNLSNLGVV